MSSCVRPRFLRSSRIRLPRARKNFFSFITHWFLEVHEQKDHEQISVGTLTRLRAEIRRQAGCERLGHICIKGLAVKQPVGWVGAKVLKHELAAWSFRWSSIMRNGDERSGLSFEFDRVGFQGKTIW